MLNLHEVKISDVIKSEHLTTCLKTDTIDEVVEVLQSTRLGSIVIVDKNSKVEGIFTERDYVMKIAGFNIDTDQETVGSYMTPKPTTLKPTASMAEAISKMQSGRFRHLIIADENNVLVNILSQRDLLDFIIKNL